MILKLSNNLPELFADAEKALKLYERISLSNLAPALNELRYAGHHILETVNANDDAERQGHELRAAEHCERARFDAKEATIVTLLECIADLRSLGISGEEMRKFIPEWDTLIDQASAARSLLERSGNAQEAQDSQAMDDAIACLMDFRDRILAAESDVLSLRDQHEEERRKIDEYNLAEKARAEDEANWAKERKEDRRYVASMLLSIAGIVLGVFGLFASVYGIFLTYKAC